MADESPRQEKLTQYLTEAYNKEKELETALEAHIGMTTKPPYKKRLKEHLRETKSHAKRLERQIKQVSGSKPGGIGTKAASSAGKAKSAAKGPMHMLRGTGEAEKMLKNAKTEYFNEHEEIATYTAIEALATALKDQDTAKLARSIRRDEERMAKFLERQIPQLTRAVVQEEVPAGQRSSNGAARASRSSGGRSSSRRSSNGRKSARRKSARSGGRARAKAKR
jgi:ferritin-like metal-binding protein YciE